MLKEFKKHISLNFSNLQEQPFLLACSGGVDSVVLAHLCAKINLDFALVHCNFKLRDADSDADERFVEQLALDLGKKYFSSSFDTVGYIKTNKVSVQMAARELRYNWFNKLLDTTQYALVVTAHQADDNLETFIINLSRGTGIEGLIGIPAQTEAIARPLLPFSREQILAYAAAENITWREDVSNAETKYLRNKIRHKILPQLKELHPTFLENFEKTQHYLRQTGRVSQQHISKLKAEIFEEKDSVIAIRIAELKKLNPVNDYLYGLFSEYGFTQWEDIANLIAAMSGKEVLSKTHRLVKNREHLLLQSLSQITSEKYKILESQTTIVNPIYIDFQLVKTIEESSRNYIYVDKSTLTFPLILRKWEEGDSFHPYGMRGKKKLSKFFKDEKVDVISKAEQWLLCSNDKIVWVVGKRADDRFKVSEETQEILKISLLK